MRAEARVWEVTTRDALILAGPSGPSHETVIS